MSRASSVIALAVLALSFGRSLASPKPSGTTTTTPSSADIKTKERTFNLLTNVTSTDDLKWNSEELMSIINECNDTFRIEMAYIEAFNEGGSFPDETDKTPKCFIRCWLEKMGVVTEEGKFDPEQAAMMFSRELNEKALSMVQDMATTCAADRKETCKCEKSYQFSKCVIEAEIKYYDTK